MKILKKTKNTGFFEKVYDAVREIPYGKVCSYGIVAKHIGAAKSARMVGWAMNGAHKVFPPVPAHRVVNRNGLLTGRAHFEYPELMQELLEEEGITVSNHQIVNLKEVLYEFEK